MSELRVCPISGHPIEDFLSLPKQPIFMGTTSAPYEEDVFHDLTWGATHSGIVQMTNRLPLDVLYAESHNSGLVGEVWKNHHLEFAKFISKFEPMDICEIGGGHGILFENYTSLKHFDSWEVFEPNPTFDPPANISVNKEIFSEQSNVSLKDCFVHSHLFEHLYDHNTILRKIYSSLPVGGKMIFSVPNMERMVNGGYINALNFEHVTYLSEGLIEHILKINGFSVLNKNYFMDDHSIFYACEKTNEIMDADFNEPENKNKIKTFFSNALQGIQRLNTEIRELPDDVELYMFGAHIFSQFYLSNGLDNSKIVAILDNDTSKHGRRLYGTELNVTGPEFIKNISKPAVVLKVGSYRDEIINQLLSLNPQILILE